jgi:hypothetical protein
MINISCSHEIRLGHVEKWQPHAAAVKYLDNGATIQAEGFIPVVWLIYTCMIPYNIYYIYLYYTCR